MQQSDHDSPDLSSSSNRYARQVTLSEIGLEGQHKLLNSSVLIIGCGALGSAQAELLARAGVGRIIIADRDILEMHNLQRQLLFDEQDVAEHLPKAVAAARNDILNISRPRKVRGPRSFVAEMPFRCRRYKP